MKITTSFVEFVGYIADSSRLYEEKQFCFSGPMQNEHHSQSSNRSISGLSGNQVSYLQGLEFTSSLMAAKCDFVQFSIALNEGDSKDFFLSHDLRILYDADPQWLSPYIPLFQDIQQHYEKRFDVSNIAACGGLLSFSHFCGRNLFGITVCSELGIDLPILLPFKRKWHIDLIELFSGTRTYYENNLIVKKLNTPEIRIFSCKSSWVFEEPKNWDSLYQLRNLLKPKAHIMKSCQKSRGVVNIYLSRYRYEVLNNIPGRVSNALNVCKIAESHGFKLIFPEARKISVVKEMLQKADFILCDPGSLFMNYMLFSHNNAKIFQLIPEPWLKERKSRLFNSQFQWYLAMVDNIIFIPSNPEPDLDHLAGDQLVPDIPLCYNEKKIEAIFSEFAVIKDY